jgi:long-chain acyl-CoA synthetase
MSRNLASILTDSAAEHGDKTAIKLDDTELSYELLDEGSARVAGMLREKGVEPGDRVGVMLPNVPYFGGSLLGGVDSRPPRSRNVCVLARKA